MKWYLSSFKIGNEPEKLKNLLSVNKKAVYISNGFDFARPESQKKHRDWDVKDLEGIGLSVESLDLRDYFGKLDQLRQKIKEFGLIWVSGGNVFDLRYAMKLSGFDLILAELKDEDIVYGGYSAAVCVLSPTLHGYHIVDKSDLKTYGADQTTIWDGLGLINFMFAPHFQSEHSESEDINKEISYYKEHGMTYRTLRDGEVIILE